VPGGIRLAAEETTTAALTANKARRGSSTARDYECNNAGTTCASTEFSTKRGVVAGDSLENDQPLAGTGIDVRDAADRPANGPLFSSRPFGGGCGSAAHDDKAFYPDLAEGGEGGLALHGDDDEDTGEDDDTAAAEEFSHESYGDGRWGLRGAAYGATRGSQADRRENGRNLLGSTTGINDTVSELSFSGFHADLGSKGEGHESEDHVNAGDVVHDAWRDSQDQARPATPRDDGDGDSDDIDASHVEHLLQERRRWKLRAFESEHELRSLHARMEQKDSTARTVEPRPAPPTETNDSNATPKGPGSFGESMISDLSAAESGFELDDRWQATSGSESSAAAALGSGLSSSPGRGEKRHLLQSLETAETAETASEGRSLEATDERGSIRSPAGGARRFDGAAGAKDTRSDRVVCGNCDLRVSWGEAPGEHGANDANQLLRQEVEELKEKLRGTELRHAAAEATAVSVLQRARSAEMSRDVKEIQVRKQTCITLVNM